MSTTLSIASSPSTPAEPSNPSIRPQRPSSVTRRPGTGRPERPAADARAIPQPTRLVSGELFRDRDCQGHRHAAGGRRSPERWLRLSHRPGQVSHFRFGGRQYFTGIIQDISERKKLEFEQQETNERLQSVMDHVVDGILTVDETGTVASFNRSAESIFGYTAAEIVGGHFSRLIPDCGRNSELTNSLLGAEFQVLLSGVEHDVVGQRKDGSLFSVGSGPERFSVAGQAVFHRDRARSRPKRKRQRIARSFWRTQPLCSRALSILPGFCRESRSISRSSLLADWCVVDLIWSRGTPGTVGGGPS